MPTAPQTVRRLLSRLVLILFFFSSLSLRGATGGSISGTVADPSGAVVAGAALKLVNTAQQTIYQAVSDRQGLYSFPNLPVGRYDLTISAAGFSTQRKINLTVDTDSAIRVDVGLVIGAETASVMVTSGTGVAVDTVATHLGEVDIGFADDRVAVEWEKLHRSAGNSTRSGADFHPVAELGHHGRCDRQHRSIRR